MVQKIIMKLKIFRGSQNSEISKIIFYKSESNRLIKMNIQV